jgi:hypothetical protein
VGLRKFFDLLVERDIILINQAAVAKTERLHVVEGRTPIITSMRVISGYYMLELAT